MGQAAPIVTAIAGLIGAGTAVTAHNTRKKPSTPQKAKTPDAELSPEDRRNKLIAQLAAGAARNNPSGGLAGTPSTGSISLGT